MVETSICIELSQEPESWVGLNERERAREWLKIGVARSARNSSTLPGRIILAGARWVCVSEATICRDEGQSEGRTGIA
jgi:hypothetical protein